MRRRVLIGTTIFILLAIIIWLGVENKQLHRNRNILVNVEYVYNNLMTEENKFCELYSKMSTHPDDAISCEKITKLASMKKTLDDVRTDLDKSKPGDIPLKTIDMGVEIVDWEKINDHDMGIWTYLHLAEEGLRGGLETTQGFCQCINSGDTESAYCAIISTEASSCVIGMGFDGFHKGTILPVQEMTAECHLDDKLLDCLAKRILWRIIFIFR